MERKREYVKRLGDKTKRLEVRLTNEEFEQLEFASEKYGKSKTDIIRDGIRMNYNLAKFKS
jgi:predicted DNA-binding protein